MSSQPKLPGTVATRPVAAAGSATAWSIAIFSSMGHRSSIDVGSVAIARSPAASWGRCSASRSISTVARATNMPAFQR